MELSNINKQYISVFGVACSACIFFCIGIKLNVSSETDCNDQKGMKTQFLSGPQAALSNHSGTSKRPDGEFIKFPVSCSSDSVRLFSS